MIKLRLILTLATAALAASTARSENGDPPNVLFIISDDLTAESLGCYGNAQCQTPHIDALAEQGVRFTRAYCQYPVCGPSRAALMSGMYPQEVGVTGNGSSDRFTGTMGKRPSMTELFRDNGYYTARISKIYHMRIPGDITAGVNGPDHAASWTERFNCQAPEWMSSGEHVQLSDGKLNRNPDKHYGLGFGTAFYVVKTDTDGNEQPDVQAASKAIELLEKHRDEPFFLAVGLVRPHVPLVAPREYFHPYPAPEMKLPPQMDGDLADVPGAGKLKTSQQIGLGGKPQKQRGVLAAYYASVSFMDDQVGRILDAVRRLGLEDDTIVVFTSDHGYHLGEHQMWQKQSLHEESVRIPLIVHVPGMPAATATTLAEQIDIYPTLAELAGLSLPDHLRGKSLVPALEDPATQLRDQIYSFRGNAHLIRTGRWAYMNYGRGGEELYDLEDNPAQFTNLASNPEYADQLAQMRSKLQVKLGGMEPAEARR